MIHNQIFHVVYHINKRKFYESFLRLFFLFSYFNFNFFLLESSMWIWFFLICDWIILLLRMNVWWNEWDTEQGTRRDKEQRATTQHGQREKELYSLWLIRYGRILSLKTMRNAYKPTNFNFLDETDL